MGTVTKNVLAARSGSFKPEMLGDPQLVQGVGLLINKITMAASYATGGDTFDLSEYFKYKVNFCIVFANGTKFLPVYVAGTTTANGKVKVVDSTSGSEVANTTDLSAQSFFLLAGGV